MKNEKNLPRFVQFIFATSHNVNIEPTWENELFIHFKDILSQLGHTVICANGHKDHVHVLCSIIGDTEINELAYKLKKSSTYFINHNKLSKRDFQWFSGYGYSSYKNSEIYEIMQKINNQKSFHTTYSFRNEYLHLMKSKQIYHHTDA